MSAEAEAEEEEWKDEDFLSFEENNDRDTTASDKQDGKDTAAISSSESNSKPLSPQQLPPWMDGYHDFRLLSPLVALHNEVVGFCQLMSPLPEEMEERDALVERFKALAHKVFGADKCEVIVFGSQATGLCLPSSDIDIVISLKEDAEEAKDADEEKGKDAEAKEVNGNGEHDKTNENDDNSQNGVGDGDVTQLLEELRDKSPLERLGDALREEWRESLSYLEVIPKTKVPLVKFTHAPTDLSVDVSFLKASGPEAATLIKTYMDAMPPLRPLIFVLKYFLAARVLNEPYSGGVGSFMLQLMIVSFLQHRERDAYNFGKQGLYNLGCLLVEFFQLYGTQFNYCTTGISVRHDGEYFRKGERKEHFVIPSRPFSMAIENPLEITTDVGKASFRISTVQRAFAAAYKVLLAHVSAPPVPVISILATIIPPTEEMIQRRIAKVAMNDRNAGTTTASATSATNNSTDDRSPSGKSPQRKKRRFR